MFPFKHEGKPLRSCPDINDNIEVDLYIAAYDA